MINEQKHTREAFYLWIFVFSLYPEVYPEKDLEGSLGQWASSQQYPVSHTWTTREQTETPTALKHESLPHMEIMPHPLPLSLRILVENSKSGVVFGEEGERKGRLGFV